MPFSSVADDFLRQELADKMSQCQYAIPFILPSMNINWSDDESLILHWGISGIRRSYIHEGVTQNKALVDLEAPLVSCLSFGEETSWKSKLMNKMLSPQQDTFWHQGLKGGDRKQKISEGMVEVGWYLPGSGKDNIFSTPITFANMRSSVNKSEGVCNILSDKSSVQCIFAEDVDSGLTDFLSQRKESMDKTLLIILHKKGEGKNCVQKVLKDSEEIQDGKLPNEFFTQQTMPTSIKSSNK